MPLSVALSGDGKTLVSGSFDGTVKVWDVGTGRERTALKGQANLVATVALSGDGKTIVSGGGRGASRFGTWARGWSMPPSRDVRGSVFGRGVKRRRQDGGLGRL